VAGYVSSEAITKALLLILIKPSGLIQKMLLHTSSAAACVS